MICSLILCLSNWRGNHAWTEALEWPGKKGFNSVKLADFESSIDGSVMGSIKSSGNFTFARMSGKFLELGQSESV